MNKLLRGLRLRLLLSYLIIGLLPFIIGFTVTYQQVKSNATDLIDQNLAAVRDLKANQIEEYFLGIDVHLKSLMATPTTIQAVIDFSNAWKQLEQQGVDATSYLQRVYIEDNPYPTGKKEQLSNAQDGSQYSAVHATYHAYYRQVQQDFGYYDLFLLNTEGDLVYSVFKELDYATNLSNGRYRNSGLAEVFKKAKNLRNGQSFLVDFAPYEPSYGAPASFIAGPIYDSTDELVGVWPFKCL